MNQIKFHKRLGLILDEIYDIFNSSTRQEQLNALLLKKLTDSKLKIDSCYTSLDKSNSLLNYDYKDIPTLKHYFNNYLVSSFFYVTVTLEIYTRIFKTISQLI